ncbi:uncharacterized protein LOC132725947 [Ruditapes philippinarum]|uniref:uncharacterized protein LOC132725947 n=1 Tax=Ruditapes philippinarum TaxID=129788 RepID=UPI00295B8989|nr:uncharacterized protein LOC132725947 [Ruditapes philippinarum]
MEISLKYSHWITLLSFVCLCVRLSVCQAPPSPSQNSQNNSNQPSACGNCRPAWITQLDGFKSIIILSNRMKSICKFALDKNVVNVCRNNNCNHMGGANFCCCPMEKLSLVNECFSKTTTTACVPNDIKRWQDGFQQAFFGGPQNG